MTGDSAERFSIARVLKALVPYGFVRLYWAREKKAELARTIQKHVNERERRRAEFKAQFRPGKPLTFTYDRAMALLDELGIDPVQSRGGSMPEASLDFMRQHFACLDRDKPVVALHVGNFLGISLAYLANALAELNPESKVVSIDPNIPHRGIQRPGDVVLTLLTQFGLVGRVAILTGYSLEKNLSGQGHVFKGYDPIAGWNSEKACTHQLQLLHELAPSRFDLCLIDGNHEAEYLQRELDQVSRLLRPGGLLVLDDVADAWPEVQAVYAAIAPTIFSKLGTDGRIGILVKT